MLYRPGSTRDGISLLEVLTAIFIMGIGMLALLTLFPLGALSMARAIRDDRAAHIAANASALATAFEFRNDTNVVGGLTVGTNPISGATFPNAPSNPVLVDPAIVYVATANGLGPVGKTGATPGIDRVAPVVVYSGGALPDPLKIPKYFTFLDEIEFDSLGGATKPGGSVNRPGTYSLAYLIRRPIYANNELAEVTVIVYANRNVDNPSQEATFTVSSATKGSTTAVLTWGGTKPDFRKGSWILDTSRNATKFFVHGYFYRIETATETGATQITVELDRPLKEDMTVCAEMPNVIAVVERGTTWLP